MITYMSEVSGVDEREVKTTKENSSEKQYTSKVYEAALAGIHNLLPECEPVQPTEILFKEDSMYGPSYLGELKGRHYVYFEKETLPSQDDLHSDAYSQSESFLDDSSAMTHELVHQWQMEQFGPIVTNTVDLNRVFPDGFGDYAAGDIRAIVADSHEAISRRGNQSLDRTIIEGVAVWSELFVLRKQIQEAENGGFTAKARTLSVIYQRHLNALYERTALLQTKKRDEVNGPEYAEGYFFVDRLYKRYGLEGTINLIKRMDLQASRRIGIDSDTYRQILENPLLTPGIADGEHAVTKPVGELAQVR